MQRPAVYSLEALSIEHAITDFETWKSAVDRFAEARREGGVVGYRIHRPLDDPAYVLVDLDFTAVEGAEAFLAVLRTKVWSVPEASPALVGDPQTRILDQVEARGG